MANIPSPLKRVTIKFQKKRPQNDVWCPFENARKYHFSEAITYMHACCGRFTLLNMLDCVQINVAEGWQAVIWTNGVLSLTEHLIIVYSGGIKVKIQ